MATPTVRAIRDGEPVTPRQYWRAVLGSAVLAVAVGTGGLFFVFLFAYGFAETITPVHHVAFLLGTAALIQVSTVLSASALRSEIVEPGLTRGLARSATLVVLLPALAVGVVVSLTHEDQNSVTADQPDVPFVALVVLCSLAAVGAVVSLVRTYRNRVSRG
ncbi:hypothetical protein ASF35_06875 [Aeromicrobium sp. Leaf291]|nr:hypothetical protein ASF35_06875 [Aeromicrobium sp. Leaf291]